MKTKTWIWIVGVAVIIAGHIVWGRLNDPNREWKKLLSAAGVECLPGGHTNLSLHIHPILTITEDGRREIVPENIGIVPSCMAEVHTHDTAGVIHIESIMPGRTFTLGQFFTVWGKSIVREGYALSITANDVPVTDPAALILENSQDIKLKYVSRAPSA